jgi:transcription elongation GreA/GreB family factor
MLAATGSVLAQEFVPPDANFVSTRTRAEVIAEIAQARADGTLAVNDATDPVIPMTGTPKSHAEVLAELVEYKKIHPYGGVDSLYYGS